MTFLVCLGASALFNFVSLIIRCCIHMLYLYTGNDEFHIEAHPFVAYIFSTIVLTIVFAVIACNTPGLLAVLLKNPQPD